MTYNVFIKKCDDPNKAWAIASELVARSGSAPTDVYNAVMRQGVCIRKEGSEVEARELGVRLGALGAEVEIVPLNEVKQSALFNNENIVLLIILGILFFTNPSTEKHQQAVASYLSKAYIADDADADARMGEGFSSFITYGLTKTMVTSKSYLFFSLTENMNGATIGFGVFGHVFVFGDLLSRRQASAPASAHGKSLSFTDSRDGTTYKAVKMPDGKMWMAENLNYQPSSGDSWCYEDNRFNCNKYGRLYDWDMAKKVCPAGWHLPSRQEWNNLGQSVGGKRSITGIGNIKWEGAGKKLKSTTGWNYYKGQSGNGTDDFGFSALPGGVLVVGYHSTWQDDGDGNWWTATESETSGYDPELCGAHCAVPDEYNAYRQRMSYFDGDMYESDFGTSSSFSVRCVHN